MGIYFLGGLVGIFGEKGVFDVLFSVFGFGDADRLLST